MSFYLEKKIGLKINFSQAFQIASDQSELGLGMTTPNPCVGCVILNSKNIITGVGYHKVYGGHHAEIEALNSILPSETKTAELTEATVVVTLEPCAHQGQTPSCAKALAELPISTVLYLLKDPNPKVSGQGQKILEMAGKKVYCIEEILQSYPKYFDVFTANFAKSSDPIVQSILKNIFLFRRLIRKQKNLNRQFLYSMISQRPYITLKWAQTLNGILGVKDQRLLVTNSEVQKYSHQLRARSDVLVLGKNTILADDPLLNNRFGSSKNKDNLIAIIDPEYEVYKNRSSLKLFSLHSPSKIIFAGFKHPLVNEIKSQGFQVLEVNKNLEEKKVISAQGFKCLEVYYSEDKIDLHEFVLNLKRNFSINSIFVEGGPSLLNSFLSEKLYSEIYLFSSLKIIWTSQGFRITLKNVLQILYRSLFKIKVQTFDDNLLIYIKKS